MKSFQGLVNRVNTKYSSKTNGVHPNSFPSAPYAQLFPVTNPKVDGEDCLHDCESCSVQYPSKFSIDEDDKLYGKVKGWSTHLVVATGKTDWVRDVADEKGSIMEAVGKGSTQPTNGKLMLSASNMPCSGLEDKIARGDKKVCTTVLLLPAFQFIDNVKPSNVPQLITSVVDHAPTNNSPLPESTDLPPLTFAQLGLSDSGLKLRACPHRYLILMCSQKTRDARCGQSAPLLRREFERQLRPLGLYRDLHDERPGGVGIYFISHVGGHKYSANVMIYRRADGWDAAKGETQPGNGEAAQCIWLARVRPEDCENIVKYTLLQGKVVKPDRQLRGGFDRCKQLVSW